MTGVPSPGTGRLAVVLSAIVAAVLAHPWRTETERWVLGVAAAVAVVSLVWWRGRYLTTIARQRVRIALGGTSIRQGEARTDATTTVLLRMSESDRQVPLRLLVGYLDRYGLVCDSVRLTTRTTAAGTTTWIGLTFDAARNLAALQARAQELPLQQTAAAAARRLVGELDEIGCTTTLVDDAPTAVADGARERWRAVSDSQGYVAVYGVGEATEEALAAVRASAPGESWTVLEIDGTPALPRLSAAAAIRTDAAPSAAVPVPGLVPVPGRQAAALSALHPRSGARLIA
ncbi:type VII secretion protein EccE [Mycolicibacterium litorale]|nr:type VII secretion protein EccE [Mycolicibacterium litorale]